MSSAAWHVALAEAVAGRLQFYDALLLATDDEAGCAAVVSEDMDPGSSQWGVRILPPFAPSGGIADEVRALL